ncbi:pentapeptide repeat-containing protein [Salinirubellus sp. GCM10025818]|uniref:pentapeptide repeat-containing protein n=1 Tax=Salinirubellus TaxID=2162630 RepID=UPI0030D43C0A
MPKELDAPKFMIESLKGCSRPIWEGADASRCVWHADSAEKPPEDLAATVEDGDLAGARVQESDLTAVPFSENSILRFADLTGADLTGADLTRADLGGANLAGAILWDTSLAEADLMRADLTEAGLAGADLAGTVLWDADLTGADLGGADLTGADLGGADLAGTILWDADLTGAVLTGADLAGANLEGADLTEASLLDADLRNALLAETILTGVSLARSTSIDDPADRIKKEDLSRSEPQLYDILARTNHELRAAYSDNGLTGRARHARVRERTARRKEAFAEESWWGTVAGIGSLLSKVITGYGVQLRWVGLVMLLLYGVSAGIYWWEGMAFDRALYYSIVTFTTSPPESPPLGIASVVAGIETFAGTATIVLLGYVLARREQV